jgi:hypothetical protein
MKVDELNAIELAQLRRLEVASVMEAATLMMVGSMAT